VKAKKERVHADLLDAASLEGLYEGYEREGATGQKNKALLGLLLFQGLKREELPRLTPSHLDLEKGEQWSQVGRGKRSRSA